MAQSQSQVAPHLIERYQSDFYPNTDLVFRFGLMITLSREGAEKLTESAFSKLSEDFSRIKSNEDPVRLLINLMWQSWMGVRGESFHKWDSPFATSLGKLTLDERVCLFLVDMVGFDIDEVQKLMSCGEKDVRVALAGARQKLVRGDIKL